MTQQCIFAFTLSLSLLALGIAVSAIAPPLREQVSLNGDWPVGGKVPVYFGERFDAKTYQREVSVPAAWTGKIIRLEFEKVAHIAEVYVNNQLLMRHVGGWIPFSVDVTNLVHPGEKFTLRVQVLGINHAPLVDAKRNAVWPLGSMRTGIIDNVWLRAYAPVHIEDAFVQTSYRQHRVTIDYTVKNDDTEARTVNVMAQIAREQTGKVEKTLSSAPVTLYPGETQTITVTSPWSNPALWTPDTPTLYLLHSSLQELRQQVDAETRRFGFRESWVAGNQYMLNGIRVNLRGDSISQEYDQFGLWKIITPENWPGQVAMLLHELHMRIIRIHTCPAPTFMLDTADEQGLLIIAESAMFGKPNYLESDRNVLLHNLRDLWIGPWITDQRNHPCIFMWSAENESGSPFAVFDDDQLYSLEETIRHYDNTRPVSYDGDAPPKGQIVNLHYPEGDGDGPGGSIYSWATKLNPNKPTGAGELLVLWSNYQEHNYWWQGTLVRGMRYVGFTDVRPFTEGWAWNNSKPAQRLNLANSYNPVALFDKDYDDLGIAPLMKGSLPALTAGSQQRRTLILYNDEFNDEQITMEVMVKSGDTVYASGSKTVTVPLGEHRDIPCVFQVPNIAGSPLQLVLTTKKGGVTKFTETKAFTVNGTNTAGATSKSVAIENPRPANVPVQSVLEIAQPFPSPAAGLSHGVVRVTLTNLSKTDEAEGRVTVMPVPDPQLPSSSSREIPFRLKPGARLSEEYSLDLPSGSYVLQTWANIMGVRLSQLPLVIPVPIKHVAEITSIDQVAAALADQPLHDILRDGQSIAQLRFALSGSDLALTGHVIDKQITVRSPIWNGSEVEIFGAMPGTNTLAQIFITPPDSTPGAVHKHEGPVNTQVAAPEIRLREALTPGGYDFSALIPLRTLQVEPEAKSFLFEVLVRNHTKPNNQLDSTCLFHSYAAFLETKYYGSMVVVE